MNGSKTPKLSDFEWNNPHGFVQNDAENLITVKNLLDTTGSGFCLAKFTQMTLHLGTGMVHSCHHPVPHKIPLDELKGNPHALFNTNHLKTCRTQMLNGEKPPECDYCWRVEDSNETSDRFYKSLEPWALTKHDEIAALSGNEDLYPSYLEVSFSNVCNMACAYCGPEFSSKWVETLKHSGPVKVLEGTNNEQWVQGWQNLDDLNYKHRDDNPYVNAFWEWFPQAYLHLKHYRITGGEPLLSKDTFRSLDWFINNPNPELELSINSNFSVPEKLWNKFIEKIMILKRGNHVKKITIYTSAEAWGNRAEYTRHGMDFSMFKRRVEQLAAMGNVRCVIMAAFNILSVSSFQPLLEWVYKLKCDYNPSRDQYNAEKKHGFSMINESMVARCDKNPDVDSVIGIDIPYLRYPEFLDIQYLTHDLVEKFLIPCYEYMATRVVSDLWVSHNGFERYEVEKLKRIITHRFHFNKKTDPVREQGEDIVINRAKFYDFINDYDRRYNISFHETFPEMVEFYEQCKNSRDKYIHMDGTGY